MSCWPEALSALRHRNFRLYFSGHAISTLGSWIQQVALAWLVYRVTGSAALLGITSCLALLPQLLVGPLAGAWIDRHDKRRLLMLVESLLGVQALGLALLVWADWVNAPLLVAMALLQGVLNALDLELVSDPFQVLVTQVPYVADVEHVLETHQLRDEHAVWMQNSRYVRDERVWVIEVVEHTKRSDDLRL